MTVLPNNLLHFIMRLIVQCAYPEKYTPLQVWQQGYLEPLHTSCIT